MLRFLRSFKIEESHFTNYTVGFWFPTARNFLDESGIDFFLREGTWDLMHDALNLPTFGPIVENLFAQGLTEFGSNPDDRECTSDWTDIVIFTFLKLYFYCRNFCGNDPLLPGWPLQDRFIDTTTFNSSLTPNSQDDPDR